MVDAVVDYMKTGLGNLMRQDAYNRMGLADFVRRVKSGQIQPTVVDAGGKVAGGAKKGLNKKGQGNITQKVVVNVKSAEPTKKKRRARRKAVAPAPATAGRMMGRMPFGGGMGGGMITPLQPYQMSNPLIQRSGFSTIQATPQRDVSAEHQLAQVLKKTQEIATVVQKPSPALLELGQIKTNPMAEMKPHSGTASVLTQRLSLPSRVSPRVSEPSESEDEIKRIEAPPFSSPSVSEVPRKRRKDAEIASDLGISIDELRKMRADAKAKRQEKKALASAMSEGEFPAPKPRKPKEKPIISSTPTASDVEIQALLRPTPATVASPEVGGARRGLNKRRPSKK